MFIYWKHENLWFGHIDGFPENLIRCKSLTELKGALVKDYEASRNLIEPQLLFDHDG